MIRAADVHRIGQLARGFLVVVALAGACRPPSAPERAHEESTDASMDASVSTDVDADRNTDVIADADVLAYADVSTDAALTSDAAPIVLSDPMSLHRETQAELLSLISIPDVSHAQRERANAFLRAVIGPGNPEHMNQGNKSIALHTTSRETCLAGLEDVVLQTPEQREICGADNMVPIWAKDQKAKACIDIFEFPNRACELPFVWVSPTNASLVCQTQGKRLCTQPEWSLACRADPDGGKDQRYAYGDVLDLDICDTHHPHRQRCISHSAKTAWDSCQTDTQPSGAFPKCRSRFGVFDQHGNVAEIMTRKDDDGTIVSQLKGSAWFYSELAREPDKPIPESTPYKDSAHPDHCNFDPRWHVENMSGALHVNYHLGFRCCKSL